MEKNRIMDLYQTCPRCMVTLKWGDTACPGCGHNIQYVSNPDYSTPGTCIAEIVSADRIYYMSTMEIESDGLAFACLISASEVHKDEELVVDNVLLGKPLLLHVRGSSEISVEKCPIVLRGFVDQIGVNWEKDGYLLIGRCVSYRASEKESISRQGLNKTLTCPVCKKTAIYPGSTLCGSCGIPIVDTNKYANGQIGCLCAKVFDREELFELYQIRMDTTGIVFEMMAGDLLDQEIRELVGKRFVIYQPLDDKPVGRSPVFYFGVIEGAVLTMEKDGPVIAISGKDPTVESAEGYMITPEI